MKKEFLKYTGHGMIERYPKSMSLTYIVGHETRHRVKNNLTALSKGETVTQNTNYSVTFSEGLAVATKGVTRSHKTREVPSLMKNHPTVKQSPSIENSHLKKRSELTTLKMTQSSIEKKILRINQALDKESDPTLLKESGSKTDGKADLVRDEQKRLEQKNFQIERKIASLKGELNVGKNVPVAEEETPGKSKPDSFPKPDSGIKEEFATLRELSNLVQDSFIFMQRSVPGAVLQDGVGSALRTQESLKSLQGQTPGTFLHSRFTFHSAFTALRTRDLQEFGTRLSKLDNAASRLGNKESLDIKPATTTEPEKISFSTSFDSPEGTFSVKVLETARGGTIASNQVEDPFSSLNLTGSFSINGYSVSVSASDSLNDIANQINFGEDNNKNGKLDFSEDVNGNGSLDKTFVSGGTTPAGYIGSFSYFEDIDADNRLDPSEDLNNNLILDGGSSQIKVSATIERDRLFLTSLSANNISLSDDTGVLKELGFFTENPSGMVIKNDRQLLQNGTNLNSERKHASLEINDIPYSKDSNEISDIIPSTVISIKKKSSLATVRIQKDFSKLINAIKEFRADYNEVIEFMNDQELSSKILDRDPHLQNARSSLIQDVVAAKPDRNLNQLSAKEAGFQHANQKRRVHQASLANLAEMVKKKSTVSLSIPFGGQNSLLGALEKGGVSRRENDFLNVDEKSVNRALQNNLNATVSLLAGNEGISRKIKTITDSFLDRMTGTLQIQQDVANIYSENQDILKQQQIQRSQLTSSGSQRAFLSTLVEKGVGTIDETS